MAYPETVSITTNKAVKENASVTYEVNAGSLPAEPSTTAGVAKVPAGELYPAYEGASDDYVVASATIVNEGTDYSINDILTIDLDKKDAKLKVTNVQKGTPTNTFTATDVEALTGYINEVTGQFVPSSDPTLAMSGYEVGQTFTLKAVESDTDAVFTISSVNNEGAITGLTITDPGMFTEDVEGDTIVKYYEIKPGDTEFIYNGSGENGVVKVTVTRIYQGGGLITSVQIIDAGKSESETVENPVSVTGGTGLDATFNITLRK